MGVEVYYKFVLSIALILIVARLAGEASERFLKQPPVLGELLAGIAISPFALGGILFNNDPILFNFATLDYAFGLDNFQVMEIFSLLAVLILLFHAGVETNVREFMKLGPGGASVAIGGVALPFTFGYVATLSLGFPPNSALFIAAVLTATSIGITVRLLMDLGRLFTREGTTILVAAVIDDILGILLLAIVVAVAVTGEFSLIGIVRLGAIGFLSWFALLIIGIKFHRYMSKFLLSPFKKSGYMAIFALLFGLLISYLVTLVGLHPVIGAYAAGLMFAATVEKEEIAKAIKPIMLFLAPFFFVFLGMQVNVFEIIPVFSLALLLIGLAIVGKWLGCYIPARLVGKFNHTSSMVVGLGMVPRGEVGLIIAAAGLVTQAIGRDIFGAAVAVSIVTTLVTPPLLKPFILKLPKGGEGEARRLH